MGVPIPNMDQLVYPIYPTTIAEICDEEYNTLTNTEEEDT